MSSQEFDPEPFSDEPEQDPGPSFASDIHEYPAYKAAVAALDQHGYPPNDPLRLFLEITAHFHRDLRELSNREVHLRAALAQQLADFTAELSNHANAIDENTDHLEAIKPKLLTFNTQAENLLKAMAEAVPAMATIQGETKKTVELLESKTSRAIAVMTAIGALIFSAGFITALCFK